LLIRLARKTQVHAFGLIELVPNSLRNSRSIQIVEVLDNRVFFAEVSTGRPLLWFLLALNFNRMLVEDGPLSFARLVIELLVDVLDMLLLLGVQVDVFASFHHYLLVFFKLTLSALLGSWLAFLDFLLEASEGRANVRKDC
jgi:hypothetical protein